MFGGLRGTFWVNLTDCLTEYSWVLVSLMSVYTYSCTVYVRIRAAPHYAEFLIKCYDVRTEINAGTAGTWMRQQTFLNFVSEMFCVCTFCHRVTSDRTKNSLPRAILPIARRFYWNETVCIQAHVDFASELFDISLLHTSTAVRGRTNVCLSDATRWEPANIMLGWLGYISSETDHTFWIQ